MNLTNRPPSADTNDRDDPPPRGAADPTYPTPGGFEQRLLARARALQLRRGACVVLGFSGGRDSLALAAAMRRVRAVLGIESLLVHVDHRLRPTSARDAAEAADLAAALDVPFRALAVEAPVTVLHPHLGLEEAARRERYRLLALAARDAGAVAVAVAHHGEDQAETVLLHLLRGSGVHGAAAMGEWGPPPYFLTPAENDISREHLSLPLWRPLLTESRQTVDAYVAALDLTWIEDPSNDDPTLRRNAVRHRILPVLEEHVPGSAAALGRYARLAADDDAALAQLAAVALRDQVDPGGRLRVAALRDYHPAVQRRMVRQWIAAGSGLTALTAERTDAVVALARSDRSGSTIEIGERWTVRRERGMLHLIEPERDPEERQ